MSGPFIIDSSVAVGWVHPAQANELTRQLLEEAKNGPAIYVPALWHLEIANTLLVFVRRKLIAEAQRQIGLTLLSQLRIIIDDETNRLAFSTISELAAKHSLSVYDAAYLELARRKSLPLATRDEALKTAARKSAIKLL
ncbi:MAG TPA: type II toxin-antitoxin system VapC family toxin [Verrucomicrobiae bacterium]|nr:type II toxin-antitoxin system VapC family toxin [Verrucomicrobiae bacterium]